MATSMPFLVFEVMEDNFDFLFGFDIDLQIMLGAGFGMFADHVLTNHDEGHQQNLNEI